jgi:uncharacterized protein (TIGR02246 family)
VNFAETLQTHLDAIQQRDIHAFLKTVAEDDNVTIILPTGTVVQGRAAVEEFHEVWFADPDWRMDVTVLRTIETSEMAFALLEIDYHDLDPNGQPYHKRYYLSLIFALYDDRWLLVHDQNTFFTEG